MPLKVSDSSFFVCLAVLVEVYKYITIYNNIVRKIKINKDILNSIEYTLEIYEKM